MHSANPNPVWDQNLPNDQTGGTYQCVEFPPFSKKRGKITARNIGENQARRKLPNLQEIRRKPCERPDCGREGIAKETAMSDAPSIKRWHKVSNNAHMSSLSLYLERPRAFAARTFEQLQHFRTFSCDNSNRIALRCFKFTHNLTCATTIYSI